MKGAFTFEEEEALDSLSSKFNRVSDLYTQKCLRTLWMLLHEPFLPAIDFYYRCEKLGILDSADELIEIRDLRNEIAHEYLPDALYTIIPEVLHMYACLEKQIQTTKNFLSERGLI